MSHIVRLPSRSLQIGDFVRDYTGYVKPTIREVDKLHLLLPFIILKSIEYSIYKWHNAVDYSWKANKYEFLYKITSKCTDRCPKCGIWKHQEGERIDVDTVIKAITSIQGNLNGMTITGGEPLIFMDEVVKIAEACHEIGLPLTVITNGFLITDDFLQIVKRTNIQLIISIDTLDPEKWEQFRGRNHYEKVMENVHSTIDNVGVQMSIQSVLAEESEEDIPIIRKFCQDNGIQHYVQAHQNFGGTWHHAGWNEEKAQNECSAWLNISLYPNGDIVKCFDHLRIPEAVEPLGNISNMSLNDIMMTKRAMNVTAMMKTCDFPCKQLRCNI